MEIKKSLAKSKSYNVKNAFEALMVKQRAFNTQNSDRYRTGAKVIIKI